MKEIIHTKDNLLLVGLKEKDPLVLRRIYADFLPGTIDWIRSQGGQHEDALDIFQESLVIIFRKTFEPDFVLTTSFGAYLAGVRKFLWWRHQRQKNRYKEVTFPQQPAFIDSDNILEQAESSEKRQLFQEKFAELGKDCQQMLRAFFAGQPLKKIAEDMGYTYDYAKKKNRICKQKLAEAVKKDARYKELIG